MAEDFPLFFVSGTYILPGLKSESESGSVEKGGAG